MCKCIVKSIIRKKKGPKQNIKKHWETIYCNIILARPTLKRYMGVKGIEANIGKENLSCNLVNAVRGNNLKALKRPNKCKKHNSNIFKNRNNRFKRLALLGKGPSR